MEQSPKLLRGEGHRLCLQVIKVNWLLDLDHIVLESMEFRTVESFRVLV